MGFSGFQAPPTEAIRSKVYYHGTKRRAAAEAILKGGLKPGAVKQGRGALDPVAGKVYVTASLHYAMIYALGGVFMEHHYPEEHMDGEPDGFLFVVPGAQLVDVQPDEDSIGYMIRVAAKPLETWEKYYSHTPRVQWLLERARRVLSVTLLDQVMDGLASADARAGKQLVKKLSDAEKLALIEAGAHVAHEGILTPSECWKIAKEDSWQLKDDGSNFFSIAERIR